MDGRQRGEWAECHWDVIAIALALAIAVGLSALLGVGYNVAASWLEPPVTGIESRPEPPADTVGDEGRAELAPGPALRARDRWPGRGAGDA